MDQESLEDDARPEGSEPYERVGTKWPKLKEMNKFFDATDFCSSFVMSSTSFLQYLWLTTNKIKFKNGIKYSDFFICRELELTTDEELKKSNSEMDIKCLAAESKSALCLGLWEILQKFSCNS